MKYIIRFNSGDLAALEKDNFFELVEEFTNFQEGEPDKPLLLRETGTQSYKTLADISQLSIIPGVNDLDLPNYQN